MPGELGRGSLHRSGVTGVAQPVQRGTAPARLELQPDLEGRGDRTRRTDRQRTELSAFGERDGALVDARDPGDVNLPKSASTASETEQPTDCEVVHESIMAGPPCLDLTGSCTAEARTQRRARTRAELCSAAAPGPRVSPPSTTPRACRSRAASG
jgi:hypothetical protein